jgi:hypothetical protein
MHVHDEVPSRGLAFVKRAVPGSARADAGNIKEGINPPELSQTCSNGIPHGNFITNICGSETCLIKSCRKGFAFGCIDANNKHGIFGPPQTGRGGRDP